MYPQILEENDRNIIIALSDDELGKVILPSQFKWVNAVTGKPSDFFNKTPTLQEEMIAMKYANTINDLMPRFIRMDKWTTEDGKEYDMMVMERLYPLPFNHYNLRIREVMVKIFEFELKQLHDRNVVHGDLMRPFVSAWIKREEKWYFENVVQTKSGLRLIDCGFTKTPEMHDIEEIIHTKIREREDAKYFKKFYLSLKSDMKIIFMGTPDFAVPSLKILVENNYQVVGVVTATDKWGGRGNKTLIESAVKKYAVSQNIPVLQPEKLKNEAFLKELKALNADLFIVVAFRMLPEVVWQMPPIGTFNLHGSLLPKYRGAAPIHWAVINGEKETGVTTFFLKHEIDTGDLLLQAKTPIGENETTGDVHDRLMEIGAETVLKTVQIIELGNHTPTPQPDTEATHAPKLFEETCKIDFSKSVADVYNFVRGLSPFPVAYTTLQDLKFKIFKAEKENAIPQEPVGTWITDGKHYLKFVCADGYLHALDVQLEGRKRMDIKSFLNGNPL